MVANLDAIALGTDNAEVVPVKLVLELIEEACSIQRHLLEVEIDRAQLVRGSRQRNRERQRGELLQGQDVNQAELTDAELVNADNVAQRFAVVQPVGGREGKVTSDPVDGLLVERVKVRRDANDKVRHHHRRLDEGHGALHGLESGTQLHAKQGGIANNRHASAVRVSIEVGAGRRGQREGQIRQRQNVRAG